MQTVPVDHSQFILTHYIIPVVFVSAVMLTFSFVMASRRTTMSKAKRGAKRAWRKIQKAESPQAVFNIVRRTHPFAFEMLVIIALKEKGVKAWHGRKFTGDGGVDGYAKIDGLMYYIQDKRYVSGINADHIYNFNILCRQHNVYGLFVHTGTTGTKARAINSDARVKIISGEKLLALLDRRVPIAEVLE